MPSTAPHRPGPLLSWTAAAALVGMAVTFAGLGLIPAADALWLSISVAAAFGPSGWAAPVGWRRRAAEVSLLPVAVVLLLVPDITARRMLVPPLLVAAGAAAAMAAALRASAGRHLLLWGSFGLAARAAAGVGLVAVSPVSAALAVTAAVVATAVAGLWGPWAGLAVGLLAAAVPLQASPIGSIVVIAAAVWLYPWGRVAEGRSDHVRGWLPGIAGGALVLCALAPWGGLSPARAIGGSPWLVAVVAILAAAVSIRLPPGVAGAVWFLAAAVVGPVETPAPERFRARLSAAEAEVVLPRAGHGSYLLDLSLRGAADLRDGAPAAILMTPNEETTLRVGADVAEAAHRRPDVARRVRHGLPERPLWRPARVGGTSVWRVAGRTLLELEPGVAPRLRRHPELPSNVELEVGAAGVSRPTPPRRWYLPGWMWGAAVVVALLQLASAGWRGSAAAVPWSVLVAGQLASRVPVEPLRLICERHAVDLALAAVVAAWLPVAWRWFGDRRVVAAVAAILVPLAVATPRLTPSLYGDEPYHLHIMESITRDGDLDITDNLDVEHRPGDRNYAVSERLMHSPVLGVLLLPGFIVAGRTGALLLLALTGAGLAALVAARGRTLGVPGTRLRLILIALVLTYPLATFATQIWVELPAALMIAAILWSAGTGGRWSATALAVLAAAMKTRLGLITFPAAAAAWWAGGRRSAGVGAVVLFAAAAVTLGFGWIALGHPFGVFRRIGDLVPTDPRLALRVVGGLFFDPSGGLLFTAPLVVAGLLGVVTLWRRGGAGERAVLTGGLLTVLALLNSPEWYGGGSPPGRYLVSLLPVVALSWGTALTAPHRLRRLAELVAAPSVLMWWALITRPHFSINPGDGGWWLSDALARRFGADVQQFFPSFLVPTTATYWVPPVVVALVLVIAAIARSRRPLVTAIVRCQVAVWLVLATALGAAIALRHDVVVEAEAPQVRRMGGRPVPPRGTFARSTHRRGWRVAHRQGISVPLNLAPGSEVWLEGWLVGRARDGARLEVAWDGGRAEVLRVAGAERQGRVRLPSPPAFGRQRVTVILGAPAGGGAVFDRLVVE